MTHNKRRHLLQCRICSINFDCDEKMFNHYKERHVEPDGYWQDDMIVRVSVKNDNTATKYESSLICEDDKI